MIAYLKGVVAQKGGGGMVLEVAGIGYELAMSAKALASMPAVGSAAQVHTYLQVKEDGVALYGFASPGEKELFCRLTGVSGVGAKMAISALSTFSPEDLAAAIAAGDVALIATVPGIGKKTAQRVVLELQGTLETEPSLSGGAGAQAPGALADATAALMGMGFSEAEAAVALKGCPASDAGSALRYALRNLGGA